MEVSCVGSGTIGCSWALLFSLNGYEVNLYDVDPEAPVKAQTRIRKWLRNLEMKGMIEPSCSKRAIDGMKTYSRLVDAVENVNYVQESVSEELKLKRKVFSEIDSLVGPCTIIASSTSGLLMSEIQKSVRKPERCIIVHPINPPHLIPLVEIVPGKKTSEDVIRKVFEFMLRLKKMPIIVRKEVPGFVFNRLSAALWREALDLLDKGVSTVEDIDKAVYAAMGLRWAMMGPFLTYHLGGGERGLEYFITHLKVFSRIWESMDTWTTIPASAKNKATKGVENLGLVKSMTYEELVSWRDEKLIELTKLLLLPLD